MPDDPVMSYPAAAKLLGVSERRIGLLVSEGKLTAERNPLEGRKKVVTRASVLLLLPYVVTESDTDDQEVPTGIQGV